MLYECKIVNNNEEEVTIKIENTFITGFVNNATNKKIGDIAIVELTLFDDLKILPCDKGECKIERIKDSFSYLLFGNLDVENAVLKSVIDFKLDREELYNYGYLDGKHVKIEVIRIDIEFI